MQQVAAGNDVVLGFSQASVATLECHLAKPAGRRRAESDQLSPVLLGKPQQPKRGHPRLVSGLYLQSLGLIAPTVRP